MPAAAPFLIPIAIGVGTQLIGGLVQRALAPPQQQAPTQGAQYLQPTAPGQPVGGQQPPPAPAPPPPPPEDPNPVGGNAPPYASAQPIPGSVSVASSSPLTAGGDFLRPPNEQDDQQQQSAGQTGLL